MLRRVAALCAVLALCAALSSCALLPNPGTTAGAKLEIGESSAYTESEIRSAMDCVLAKFPDFAGCDLTRLWYDEEWSDKYHNYDGSADKIMLLSDFTTDGSHGHWYNESGFEPDSTYRNWQWSLVRENPESAWEVKDWGYG